MKKLLYGLGLLSLFLCTSLSGQKKVYADYHGIRRTRLADGDHGEWKYASQLSNNSVAKQVTYNPDLIIDGKHQIAAVNYPAVGVHSQFDPEYLEYQILSAKAAGIDGFFVEWGYMDHSAHDLLQTMLPIARKYSFEVGVNLCGWLMTQDWITSVRPDIQTREQRVAYFKECMQWLIDNVYSAPTAPLVDGRPVLYFFGDGFSSSEFKSIQDHTYTYPEVYPTTWGKKFPQVVIRTMLNPTLVGGIYTPKSPATQAGNWLSVNRFVPTPWMPERVRSGVGSEFSRFNVYATSDDCSIFLRKFATDIWGMGYGFAAGFVAPGMDNYGCAGWSSTGKLSCIPRLSGQTYKDMWQTNLQYRNLLNMIYIASWSDYTEGHEIEPTHENGDRELRTTLQYASTFKGISSYDESGIELPKQLFDLRKTVELCRKVGLSTSEIDLVLDAVAQTIALGNYPAALQALSAASTAVQQLRALVEESTFTVPASQVSIVGNKHADGYYILSGSRTGVTINDAQLKQKLRTGYYRGTITYDYFDGPTWGANMNIISGTDRQPVETFKWIGLVKDAGVNSWVSAQTLILKENMLFGGQSSGSDLSFYSNGTAAKLRNVSFEFTLYSPQSSAVKHLLTHGATFSQEGRNVILSGLKPGSFVRLFDAQGRLLRCISTQGEASVDLSDRSEGLYLIGYSVQTSSGTFKAVVVRD